MARSRIDSAKYSVQVSDYSRLQLNGLQIGQPGTAPLRYGNRPRHNRGANKTTPDNPCPTCGQPLTTEPTMTVTRDGRTFTVTYARCTNARKTRPNQWTGKVEQPRCQPKKTETEITDMPRHEHPVKIQPREWVDSVNTRRADLGLSQAKLAKRAGIHMSMLTKALSEHYGATEATVWAIDNALAMLDHEKQESEHYDLQCHAATQHGNTGVCAARCGRLVNNGADLCDECSAMPPTNPPKDLGNRPSIGTAKPIAIVREPSHTIAALQERTATLAGQQDRFWCELNEAMKRINTCEARIEDWARDADGVEATISNLQDAHESLTDACTLRIGNLEHRANTQHSEFSAFRDSMKTNFPVILDAQSRITTAEAEINNLAKSVEHLARTMDLDEAKLESLAKTVEVRCCAREATDHDNAIAFLELAVQTLTQRIADLEARDTEKFAMRVIECLAGRLG